MKRYEHLDVSVWSIRLYDDPNCVAAPKKGGRRSKWRANVGEQLKFLRMRRRLKIYDLLSAFFGATSNGVMIFGYADVVKLAGHSCPTVVAAYLMTLRSLGRLYGETLPVRGDIEVYFRDRETSSVSGVMANIVSFLTGAAGGGGFKGMQGALIAAIC